MEQREFQQRAQEIERLVQRVQALDDPNARATALDLMRSLMDLHGAVLARILELSVDGGDAGRALLARLCDDPMIAGLLVLYGLHPLDLEERVAAAVEKLRPDLQARGVGLELLGVSDAAVRVRVQADGCGSAAGLVKSQVEQAICDAAPEVLSVVIEGVAAAPAAGFVPLAALQPNSKENRYEKPAV